MALTFFNRYPEYSKRRLNPFIAERRKFYDSIKFRAYFEKFKAAVNEYNILLEDLYNMDETEFRIDYRRAYKMITRRNK
jgi:hypothetical protein